MEVYRGPRTGNSWELTDSKAPKEYIKTWANGGKIVFDGTIDKTGQRHTDLGILVEDTDVVELFNALIKRDRQAKLALRKELREAQEDAEALRDVLRKIYRLLAIHADKAPSQVALLETVQSVASHYAYYPQKDSPDIEWIRWNRV